MPRSDRPIRLLLVDDDDWDCAALHHAVEQTGVPVEWRAVHSAEEAEQWRGGGYAPDVIIVDNGLPGTRAETVAFRCVLAILLGSDRRMVRRCAA